MLDGTDNFILNPIVFGHGRIPPIVEVSVVVLSGRRSIGSRGSSSCRRRRSFLLFILLLCRRVSIMLMMMLVILVFILILVCILILVFILRSLIISISISTTTTTCTTDGIVVGNFMIIVDVVDVVHRGHMVDFVDINRRDDRCNDQTTQ